MSYPSPLLDDYEMAADLDNLIHLLEYEVHIGTTPFRFLDLPGEIQENIVNRLNLVNLASLKTTSRALRNLVTDERWDSAIQQVQKEASWRFWGSHLHITPTPLPNFSVDDLNTIYKCLPCLDCRALRLRGCFGMLLKGRGPQIFHQFVETTVDRVGSWASARANGNPYTLKLEDRCLDGLIKHPEYHFPFFGPRNLPNAAVTAEGWERVPIGGRWIELQDAVALECVRCEEWKVYPGYAPRNTVDWPFGKPHPSVRQVNEDLCHSCWGNDHQDWLAAKDAVYSCLEELEHELLVIRKYCDFMDGVDTVHPHNAVYPCARDSERIRNQQREPERVYMLEEFPDWSEELYTDHGLPVPDVD